jgi:single-strand DNA-binding protein
MAGETLITIIGNLTNDPELRFTPSGAAVANFTVASTPRNFDRQSNEWKDGETLFMRCSVWREAAENVAESLTRGTRVIVNGRHRPRRRYRAGSWRPWSWRTAGRGRPRRPRAP